MNEVTEQKTEIAAVLHTLMESGHVAFAPCPTAFDLEDKSRFSKLEVGPAQKMHLSALMQQVPAALAAGTLAQAYVVRFPEGLPHVLTALKQGGFGSMIQDGGRFVGSASFHPMQAQAAFLGAFSAMSIVTGQYFLAQINQEMDKMNLKLGRILEFLYGEKKAELTAEIDFTKYAFENYLSIMDNAQQRLASITNLQAAKKVAMKDIEFYMADLDSIVNAHAKGYVDKAFQIKDSLDLSVQLYVMSSLLEVYYAQNYDSTYLSNLERDLCSYIDKCEKRTLSAFSPLNQQLHGPKPHKAAPLGKMSKNNHKDPRAVHPRAQEVELLVDSLRSGEESALRKNVKKALRAAQQPSEYYIDGQQNIYAKLP